jgi:superfamily I DNA/RNA helicase
VRIRCSVLEIASADQPHPGQPVPALAQVRAGSVRGNALSTLRALLATNAAPMAPPLNPAQRDAVEHFFGPILVLAGAGSGKTRVITHRIARLVERGIAPSQIVALTFTNKAAAEMAERVAHVMKERGAGDGARGLLVSTFHSFGLQVLSREAREKREAFTIFDQGDQLALVKELVAGRRDAKSYDASAILARISAAKNAFISPDKYKTRLTRRTLTRTIKSPPSYTRATKPRSATFTPSTLMIWFAK